MEDQRERIPLVEEKVRVKRLTEEESVPSEGRIPVGGNLNPSVIGRISEDGCESMSGSGNLDGGLEDDQETEVAEKRPAKKQKYHRHTQEQINELEAYDLITCFFPSSIEPDA